MPALPAMFSLILNELMSVLGALKLTTAPLSSTVGSSLQYCHKIQDVFEYSVRHWDYYISITSIMYLCIVCSAYVFHKWRIIFRFYLFVGTIIW